MVNVQVTTISALAFDVLDAELTSEARLVASLRAKRAIVEQLLHAHAGTLKSLTSATSLRRLADHVLHSIEVLRMAGLRPEQLEGALRDAAKARDLALLMREYEQTLDKQNLIDGAGELIRAAAAVRRGARTPTIERILVPSDLDLAKCERDLLDAFRAAKGITVDELVADLPLPEQRPSMVPDPKPVDEEREAAAWSARFFRAVGEANEVRHVLRTCLAKGLRFDEVEIVHTDSVTYPGLIRELVAALPRVDEGGLDDIAIPRVAPDVPVTFAEGLPVSDSKPGRALTAWMKWRRDGHPQSRLERMLREGLLQLPSDKDAAAKKAGKKRVSAAALMRMMRSLNVGRGLIRLSTLASEELQRTQSMTAEEFAAQREDDGQDLDAQSPAEIEAAWRRRVTTLESLVTLSEMLAACEPEPDAALGRVSPKTLLEGARRFVYTLCGSGSEFDANARNRLREEIEEAIRWQDHDQGAGLADISLWLEQLPSELVVMGAGPRPGCLHVSPMASGGHSGRPYTFVIGLDEDRFPGGEADDPVLTDIDRAQLNAAHEQCELTEARGASRRNLDAWWKLLARLGGQIVLGYSCRDTHEGAEMFPSPALLSLFGRMNGTSLVKVAEFLAALGDPETFVPRDVSLALDETQARLAAVGPNAPPDLLASALCAHRAYLSCGHQAELERRSDLFTAYDGNVPAAGPCLDPCASGGRAASPNSLETLGTCPRRFFFRYGLGIRPPETREDDSDRWLSALEAGTVLHAVLEKFVRRLIERSDTPKVCPAQMEELLDILASELNECKRRTPPITQVAFDATQHELADALATFLSEEARLYAVTGMRPIAIEVAIGLDPSEPGTAFDTVDPVTIELPSDKKLQLRGRIDRIDVIKDDSGEQIYSLWDYKSGSAYRFPEVGYVDPFDRGRKLQHGLYILMLRARIEQTPDAATSGRVERFGYFFPSRAGKGKRLEWSAARLERCAALVGQLAEIARQGAFLPTTSKQDCDYCKFTTVCGEPAEVARQASRMAAASPVLTELFRNLTGSSRTIKKLDLYRVNNAALALTPHTQGPKIPPDEDVRRRIRTDLKTSLLVEASAGTGKTTCIIDRLLSLIRTGSAKPQAIVAVTFTRKAAGELRRRFREELHAEVAKALVTEERRRLVEAVAHADSMIIGTIHAFAARLLRERAVAAAVDPGFTELDEAADRLLREQAWHAFVDVAPRDHPKLLETLASVGLRLGDLRFAFVDKFADYGDVEKWPAASGAAPDITAVLTSLEPFVRKIRAARFRPVAERGTDELMNDLEDFVRMYDRTDRSSTVAVMELAQTLDRESKQVLEHWPGVDDTDKKRSDAATVAAKEWKKEWEECRARVAAPALWTWRAHRYPAVIEALMAARAKYEELRHERGALSFQDLLSKTVALLKTSSEAREGFRGRYTHILVDEFQDTDPIQAEMLLLLCATDPREKDALTCVPVPGSLFVVGDPKQSLYRFRRADIVTYVGMKQIFAKHGAILELTTNFRSRSDLVAFANVMFGAEFPATATKESPAFVEATSGRRDGLTPERDVPPQWLTGVRAIRYARSGYEGDEWVIEEARVIAEFIRSAIDGKYHVPRTEAECQKRVPAECSRGDFLIVARERSHLSIYAAALQAVDLPVDVTGAIGADHAESLRALRGCLAAVADPDDPVAILALLRGPVFGFSDTDLLSYKEAGGSFYGGIDEPEALSPALRKRCEEAKAALGRWRRWVRQLPVAAAVERIIDDAGLLLIASCQGETGSGGRAVVGIVQRYLEGIRRKRESVVSIHDCLDALDDLLAPETKEQLDPLAIDPDSGNRVRLMNLHKAKGLEAPVVFLCDYRVRDVGDKPEDGPTLHVDRTGAEAQGWLAVTRQYGRTRQIIAAPNDWQKVCERERAFEAAERTRIDYVAATRAGTCLIISLFGTVKKATKKPPRAETFTARGAWERFGPYFTSMPDLPHASPPPISPCDEGDESARQVAAGDSDKLRRTITAGIAELTEPTFARITPREILTESAEGLKYTGHGRGEEWGRAIHKLLELAMRMPEWDIEKVAATVLSAEEVPPVNLPDAVKLVREIMVSEVWRQSQESKQHYSEVPFSIQVAGESLSGEARIAAGLKDPPVPTVIRGVIDRVFEDHAGTWRVVDWKTDSVTAASRSKLDDYYRPQVGLYAECWRLIRDNS